MTNNFKLLRKFLSKKETLVLASLFHQDVEKGLIPFGDGQCPGSYYAPDYFPFLQLLCDNNKRVGDIIKEPVFPTYCYARYYKRGEQLLPHTDREACEVSISLSLYSDADWPIYMKPQGSDKTTEILLRPGDAVLYDGVHVTHWREQFKGDVCMQVFLHYVKSNGPNYQEIFDRKMAAAVGVSQPFHVLK